MKKFLFVFALLFNTAISFANYWHPYPINVVIGVNGTQQRLELSVWDSVMGSWQYYNSPYFSSHIDTSFSSSEIIALKTYFPPNLYDNDSIYGYITYDPVLHQFMPVIKFNSDPDVAGATVFVSDNVVGVITRCCEFNTGLGYYYDITAEAFTYDINQHEWRGGLIKFGYGSDHASVGLSIGTGGFLNYSYNDFDWNPMEGVRFYTPSMGTFTSGAHFFDTVNGMSGNQDQLYCAFQIFVYNDISSIRIYNPNNAFFPGFVRSIPGIDVMNGGMTYQSYPDSNLQFFTMFDDFSNEMKIDTIDHTAYNVIIKNRVAAYIDSSTSPVTVHYRVFSPTLHQWVKDSTVSINGVSSLSIIDGTVHWVDNVAGQYKAGYNDTIGWGNFDTPLQLMFQVTDLFPTMGVPLIFVRDYSIGSDSAHFYFGDGYSTTYAQGSAWHQYKINGTYNATPADTFEICIETVTSAGNQIACKSYSFTTPMQGGIAAASVNLICPGDSSMLTVSGHNGPVQWQFKIADLNWQDDTVAVSDTLFVHPLKDTYYRAKISNGTDAPAFSNLVKVSVIPSVTNSPIWGNSVVCNGYQEYFSVDSIPGTLNYTWTLPPGWLGSSTSSSILATTNSTGGFITVSANTICGTVSPLSKMITVTNIDTSLFWSGNELWSNAVGITGVTYKWIDCLTNIEVGSWEFFEPTQNGSYACIISYDDCTDTSSCWLYNINTGITSQYSDAILEVAPNPSTNSIILTGRKINKGNYSLELLDVCGQRVYQEDFISSGSTFSHEINIEHLKSGIYFLHLKSNYGTSVLKVMKN